MLVSPSELFCQNKGLSSSTNRNFLNLSFFIVIINDCSNYSPNFMAIAIILVLCRYHNRSNVTEMLADFQWKSLQDRRRDARLTMLYRINNDLVASDQNEHILSPTRLSRHSQPHTFQIPRTTTTYKQQSVFPRTIRERNRLAPDTVSAGSIDAFKAHLAKHFA